MASPYSDKNRVCNSHPPTTHTNSIQQCRLCILAENQNPLLFFVHCDAKTRWHFGQIDVHKIITTLIKTTLKMHQHTHKHTDTPIHTHRLIETAKPSMTIRHSLHLLLPNSSSTSPFNRLIYNFHCSLKLDHARQRSFSSFNLLQTVCITKDDKLLIVYVLYSTAHLLKTWKPHRHSTSQIPLARLPANNSCTNVQVKRTPHH